MLTRVFRPLTLAALLLPAAVMPTPIDLVPACPGQTLPSPSAFTYQGKLETGGAPLTGVVSLAFTLYTDVEGGLATTPSVIVDNVQVDRGLFTAKVDFGTAALEQRGRWLQIGVKEAGSLFFTPLAPRQYLSNAPTARTAERAAGWSRNDVATVDVDWTAEVNYPTVPIAMQGGQPWTQTFTCARSGGLTSVRLKVATIFGLPTTALRVTLLRGSTPLAFADRSASTVSPVDVDFDFPVPPGVVAGEVLSLRLDALAGTPVLPVYDSPTDLYSGGALSGSGAGMTYPDLGFITFVLDSAAVNPSTVRVTSGDLRLERASDNAIFSIKSGAGGTAVSGIGFFDVEALQFGLGKDSTNAFFLDVSGQGRLVTVPAGSLKVGIGTANPANRLSVAGDTDLSGKLGVGGPIGAARLSVTGDAAVTGALTLGASLSAGGALSVGGTSTLSGSTAIGVYPTSGTALTVRGLALLENIGVPALEVGVRIRHLSPTSSGWPVRLENVDVAGFQGGMRLSAGGFVEVTNRAGSGLMSGFARLDRGGTGAPSATSA